MAYQAKRSQKVIEDVDLIREDGSVQTTLRVNLDACSVVDKINDKYINLVHIQQEVQRIRGNMDDPEIVGMAYEKLGKAVIEVFEAVFGPEDTQIILEFYENRYMEMCEELMPFVTAVVIPKVREVARESRQKIIQKYNRQQRRSLGLFGGVKR